MKDEYISISEFARRAGVSRQAIQQRLDTSLRDFVKDTQGKKLLNSKGLELFRGASLAQGLAQGDDNLAQGVLDLLRAELEAKNQQLRDKDQQLREKDLRIAELTDRLAEMGMRAQELHAGTMVQQLGPGSDQGQEPEPTIDVDAPAATSEPAEPEPITKKHWWQRRRT